MDLLPLGYFYIQANIALVVVGFRSDYSQNVQIMIFLKI